MLFVNYILIAALSQGFVLAFFLLFSRYYRSLANRWLALSLIILSATIIIDIVGEYYHPTSLVVEFFINDLSYDFLVYLPLYLFFKISTEANPVRKHRELFYLILPFLIDTVINLFIVTKYSLEAISNNEFIQQFYEVEGVVSLVFNLLLCYFSYQLIKKYHQFPDTQKGLYKIWRSTIILIALWAVTTFGNLFTEAFVVVIPVLYSVIALWLFWMIYNGVIQLNLINDRKSIRAQLQHQLGRYEREDDTTLLKGKEVTQVATKTEVNLERLSLHFDELNALMKNEHLYRDEDLSIDDVASRFDMSAGYVSQIISKTSQKNFPTWVNEYRVNAAKEMLSNVEFNNYTILAIGLEAGFKSKSAFYASFKNFTGQTPSEYKKGLS